MPDKPQGEEQPKIIIDEDWKSQAQAEKEALARQRTPEPPAADPAPASPTSAAPELEPGPGEPFPPASLTTLISMLATQAMLAMGQGPNPLTGQVEVQLDFAKYLIDTLSVLEEKTQGNRTPQEIALLSSVLHELRMAYVASTRAAGSAGQAKS